MIMHGDRRNTQLNIDLQDIQEANQFLRFMAQLYAQRVDIHTHTTTLGKAGEYFKLLDQLYKINRADVPLQTVCNEIRQFCDNDVNVGRALDSIILFKDQIEGETKQNGADLLIRVWELSKKFTTLLGIQNAQTLIIDNLKHNRETGGGCYAGICARLIQPYSVFLMEELRRRAFPEANIERPRREDDEALQMEIAIAESLLPQFYQMREQGDNFHEENRVDIDADEEMDPELAEAIRLSLQQGM